MVLETPSVGNTRKMQGPEWSGAPRASLGGSARGGYPDPPQWETLVKCRFRSPSGFLEGVSRGWFLKPPRWETLTKCQVRSPSGFPEGVSRGWFLNPPRSETLARERGQVTNLAGTTAKGDEPDLVILGGWGRNATGKDRQRDRERGQRPTGDRSRDTDASGQTPRQIDRQA